MLSTQKAKEAWRVIEAFAPEAAIGFQEVSSEPQVIYQFASNIWRTSPAEVFIPAPGHLCYGTIDHRLSERWLNWRGVTHVINVLGQWTPQQDPRAPKVVTPEWVLLHKPEIRPANIKFMDWCPTYARDRARAQSVFELVEQALCKETTVLFVHCKNGRDRSGTTVYMLLRIVFNFSHDEALSALRARVGTNGGALLPKDSLIASAIGWVSSMQFQ